MSSYKQIKTEFKNGHSLMKALEDLGAVFECGDVKQNERTLKTSWGARWNGADQKVAIAIQKEQAQKCGLGSMDGLGFRWNGASYDLVADRYDENSTLIQSKLKLLAQRYALAEVKRQAKMKGYSVNQVAQGDGSIWLVLAKR